MKINWEKILFWLLILIVITLPLQVTELLFPVRILGSRFPTLELSRIITVIGILAVAVRWVIRKKITIPKDAISVLLYIFVGINILSLAFYPSNSGLLEVLRYLFYLGFFVLAVNAVRRKEQFENITKAIMIGGFLISLFAIFQYFSGFYLWNESLGSVVNRVNATFLDPNVLATFLGILIIVSTAYYSFATDRRYKIFSILVAAVSLSALFFTFSRAGLVSFGAAFLFLVLVMSKNLKMLAFYVLLALVAGIVYFGSGEVKDRTANIYSIVEGTTLNSDATFVAIRSESSSPQDERSGDAISKEQKFRDISVYLDRILSFLPFNYDRTSTVKAGILMLIDKPILGIGLGNFQEVYTSDYSYLIDFRRKPTQGNPITLLHSSFVALVAELGLVGFVWLAAFLFVLTKSFIRFMRENSSVNIPIIAYGAGLLLLFIHTQFRGSLFSDPYFWLLISFMVTGQRLSAVKS
jgi:O-antigen ligase